MKTIYKVYEDAITESIRTLITNAVMVAMGCLSFAAVAVVIRMGLMLASAL